MILKTGRSAQGPLLRQRVRSVSSLVSEPNSCPYISGEGGIRGKGYSDTCQFGMRASERFFALCSREEKEENSSCRLEEEIDNHPILKRRGKCLEEEVGRCKIQKWKERCVIYDPNSKTWRQRKDAQSVLGI
jgi:hypothetical protein